MALEVLGRLCRQAAACRSGATALDIVRLQSLGGRAVDLHAHAQSGVAQSAWQALRRCCFASGDCGETAHSSIPSAINTGCCNTASSTQAPDSSADHQLRQLSNASSSSSQRPFASCGPSRGATVRSFSSWESTPASSSLGWQRHQAAAYTSQASTSQPSEAQGDSSSSGASKGLISYDLAPKPLPRYRKVEKDFKWKRMVIRIPPQVTTELQGSYLTLSGQAGSIRMNLDHMDPTGLLGMQLWQQQQQQPQQQQQGASSSGSNASLGTLLLCVSPSKRCFRGIATHIDNAVTGVTQGFLVGLTVKGVGYRLEPVEEVQPRKRWYFDRSAGEKAAAQYPYKQAAAGVRMKVGYSYPAVFPLPEGVRGFFIRPNLMYLYGVELAKVKNTAMAIRAVRPPNTYTGNGVQLVDEVIKLRPRGGTR